MRGEGRVGGKGEEGWRGRRDGEGGGRRDGDCGLGVGGGWRRDDKGW